MDLLARGLSIVGRTECVSKRKPVEERKDEARETFPQARMLYLGERLGKTGLFLGKKWGYTWLSLAHRVLLIIKALPVPYSLITRWPPKFKRIQAVASLYCALMIIASLRHSGSGPSRSTSVP